MGCIRRYISKEMALLMDEMKLEEIRRTPRRGNRRITDQEISKVMAKKLKRLNNV